MKISKIGFYGIKNIGPGLVQSVAMKGLTAVVYEKNSDLYDSGVSIIERNADYEIEHWGMTLKEKKVMMSRIDHVESFEDLVKQDIDLIIESVEESIQSKKGVIQKLEEQMELNIPVVLTSQTNPISSIVDDLPISARTVNIHPIPSVPVYKLVELIRHHNTTESALEIINSFFEKIDLKPVDMTDGMGGVGPRILISTVLESCDMMAKYSISGKSIDTIMRRGLRMYKGPLTMADEVGLDNIKMWIEEMAKEDNNVYKVPEIIIDLLDKGHTGLKAGRGFLNYK